MRLKTFHAKTMTEAMNKVREALGEDAIIIATREEKGGRGVRVTAAIESDRIPAAGPAFEIGAGGQIAAPMDWLQYDEEDEGDGAVAERLTDAMLRHAVPEDVTDQIVSCAMVMGLEEPSIALTGALESLFMFRPLPVNTTPRPLMLVGPPGSGKTLAVAKLATRGVMSDLKIAVVTTDTVRAGGVEQLEAFTRLLKIDLRKVKGAEGLKQALAELSGFDQVLIDTAGVNPFDPASLRDIARFTALGAEPVLALPAGVDAEESGEMGRTFAALGVKRLLPTRLDIARRLGGLLAAAHHGRLMFSDASNTAQVADGLMPLSPRTLSQLLMPGVQNASPKTRKTM